MPSRYEPCGLGQIISLKYGTIPVVRSTGGLADTITPFDEATGEGNGFAFSEYSATALMGAMTQCLLTYRSRSHWGRLMDNALAADFSWGRSAQEYVALYERAIARRREG
jgi:starch synthase